MQGSELKVDYATTLEQKEKIYQFRYNVYVEEMGKTIQDVDHTHQRLTDEFDEHGRLFFVQSGEKIVATARANILGQMDLSSYWKDLYQLEQFKDFSLDTISMTSKLMVDKDFRGSNVLGLLLFSILQYAKEEGIKFDFCNCSPHLIELYECLGYKRYCSGFIDEDTGYHIPMVFLLEDIQHMKEIRSPFYRILKKYDSSMDTRIWFDKAFPTHKEFINRRLIDTDDFWNMLENKLSGTLLGFSPLFKNMNENEIKEFIGMSTVLKCKKGEHIIRPGDIGKEMYVILSGIAEVKSSCDKDAFSLAILPDGQIFGEMAFVSQSPRNAAVMAETDIELLLLTQAFFNKCMSNSPQITAKILLNLSIILCERLQLSTNNWIESLQN